MRQENVAIPSATANTLVDPEAHASGELHEACRWLRANIPFGLAEPDGYDPFWVATKQADLKAISVQNELFHSGDRNIFLVTREEQERIRELTGGRGSIGRNVVNMDPPDHPKYRAVAVPYFSPRSVLKLESQVRAVAQAFADRLRQFDGSCDFAREIAFEYPLRVIMSILGVPEPDQPYMLRLSQELFGVSDPDQARDGIARTGAEATEAFAAVNADFDAYLGELLADRRRAPRDDFASVIANGTIDGTPLPSLEAIEYCKVVATAGHDTTSSASAGGIWGLAENPDEFARIKADPSLMPGLVDESIRYTTPAKITIRTATRDTEYAGHRIEFGQAVALAWVSGNRDEDVYDDPFAFRIGRPANKMVGFGWGPHNCIGRYLAQIELRMIFEEVLSRIDSLELAGTPKTLASLVVSGPKTVPIRYRLT